MSPVLFTMLMIDPEYEDPVAISPVKIAPLLPMLTLLWLLEESPVLIEPTRMPPGPAERFTDVEPLPVVCSCTMPGAAVDVIAFEAVSCSAPPTEIEEEFKLILPAL